MLVLGIETSCDETCAALVEDGRRILCNVVSSQVELHSDYGGVVPEIASRAHLESIAPVLAEALAPAALDPELVAFTAGPGLVGSLVVGVTASKGLAWAWGVPAVAVNHLEAHAMAPVLEGRLPRMPFLALVVSGGHTVLAEVKADDDMEIIGETLDDAVGEAFDKVSAFLGLGYPGGPVIERLARDGDPEALALPRPMMHSGDLNFSMSGLKTAVIRAVGESGGKGVPDRDVAASFQAAVVEVLTAKTVRAALETGTGRVVLGGGVACNHALRSALEEACGAQGIELVATAPSLCTDNAAMVGALGYTRFRSGYSSGLDCDVFPNLRMGEPLP